MKTLLLQASLLLLLVFISGRLQGAVEDTCTCAGQCVCKTANGTIDLRHYFTYPLNGTPGNIKYTYSFSPCCPMSCSPGQPDTAAVCRYNNLPNKEDQAVSLGMVKGICWRQVINECNFTIVITGGDPTPGFKQRQSVVLFKCNSSISTNTFVYVGKNSTDFSITYFFEVMIADAAKLAKPFKHLDLKHLDLN